MTDKFKKLWNKINEPHIERLLMVLLPFVTLLIVAAILAPNLLAFMEDNSPPQLPSPSPAAVEMTAVPIPSMSPPPAETPAPVNQYDIYGNPIGWHEYDGKSYYYRDGRLLTGLEQIDGKLCFFDQNGVKAEKLGIDVSQYNKFIHWPAVAAQGIDFAIIRAGGRGWESGLIYDDPYFQRNLHRAKAAGIDVGVYFYSTANEAQEAYQEAEYVLGCLGDTELDFPIYIDVEYSGDYPAGRADRLSNSRRSEIIEVFCRTIEQAGYKAGVYSGQHYYKYNLDVPYLSRYNVWLASYTNNSRLPNFPWDYDIWQFTEGGYVNGIRGIVDMNVIF